MSPGLQQTATTEASMAVDFGKLFVREFERHDGQILKISQSEIGDVGCVVWDAAMVLAAYLGTENIRKHIVGKTAVELGAGTGLVGLQAACEGAVCEITDLPEIVPLIELNIRNNSSLFSGSAKAISLDWEKISTEGKVEENPDYILLADCIYYPQSIKPLVESIKTLAGPETEVLCCHEERTTDNKPILQKLFFEMMSKHFQTEKVPLDEQDSTWRSEDILIHRFRKR